jgi:predicted O-methyltransferase YrrM
MWQQRGAAVTDEGDSGAKHVKSRRAEVLSMRLLRPKILRIPVGLESARQPKGMNAVSRYSDLDYLQSVPRRLVRRLFGRAPAMVTAEATLQSMDEPFRSALLSMYRNERQIGTDGQEHEIDPSVKLPPSEGWWLYALCREIKPKEILEIGTCYGFSSLFFLAAITKNGLGRVTSIDPYEEAMWHGIALASVQASGAASQFQHLAERSDRASTDLARQKASFQVIFIDGSHRFDEALTDFYLFAPLCAEDGYVIFDDLWMPSIQSVISFVRGNRPDFREQSTGESNIAVFKRMGQDLRSWDHFQNFAVASESRGSQ